MPKVSLSFHFSQPFPFPAEAVDSWATNDQPDDLEHNLAEAMARSLCAEHTP